MNFQHGTRASYLNDLLRRAQQFLNAGQIERAAEFLRDPDATEETGAERIK